MVISLLISGSAEVKVSEPVCLMIMVSAPALLAKLPQEAEEGELAAVIALGNVQLLPSTSMFAACADGSAPKKRHPSARIASPARRDNPQKKYGIVIRGILAVKWRKDG